MDEKPDTLSSDAKAMAPYHRKVRAILGGIETMKAVPEYLPRFASESPENYKVRLESAKFTNIFSDIVENLAQRPFSRKVEIVEEGAPQDLIDFQEDVDGRGNHLHTFAGEVFYFGIAQALHWILVDYTRGVPTNASRAEEKRIGARPYWVKIPAESMIAVYSAIVDGRDQIVHARFKEPAKVRTGWGEVTRERVRVLTRDELDGGGYGPARFEVWEKQEENTQDGEDWFLIDEGPISIGEIPLVPFITGRRKGDSWQFDPPMRAAAEQQIKHYQKESALEHIDTLTAFPMLAGNGVEPPIGEDGKRIKTPVGPSVVLYAKPYGQSTSHGEWSMIEPAGTSLSHLEGRLEGIARELRELGRQPLTAQSGNLTVVTTAYAAQKGNAAIQAWALNLKDALENALIYTAKWLKVEATASVSISTDFSLGFGDDDSFTHVLALGTGEAPMISRGALIHEAKRRDILDPDYDADADLEAILTGEDE